MKKRYTYNRFSGTDIVVNESMRGAVEKLNWVGVSTQVSKNLFDTLGATVSLLGAGTTISTRDNNQIILNGTAGTYRYAIFRFYLKAGTYTVQRKFTVLSGTPVTQTGNIIIFNDGITTSYLTMLASTPSASFTVPSDGYYKIYMYISTTVATTDTVQVKFYDIQIEPGSTATSWASYNPTPDYPVPIYNSADEGKIQVWSHKKNMFNISESVSGRVDQTTGNIVSSTVTNTTSFIKITNNENYRFTYNYSSLANTTPRAIGIYDKDKTFITYITYTPTTKTYLLNFSSYPTCAYIRICYDINATSIQLELGSTATPYEPYTGSIVDITTPVGYIGGSLPNGVADTDTQKKIGKVVLNGSESWVSVTQSTGNTNYYYAYTTLLDNLAYRTNENIEELCDKFKTLPTMVTSTIVTTDSISLAGTMASYSTLRIMILKSRVDAMSGSTLIDKFKAYLATNPVTLYYQLATPVDITITKPLVNTYDGANTITTTNNVKPSLTIEAWKR